MAQDVFYRPATKRNAYKEPFGARKIMKTFRHIAAALLFCSLAIPAVATAKHHRNTPVTARTAADDNHRLQLIEQSLTDDGYQLADVSEEQIKYFAPQVAPYNWGHITYTYTRIVPGRFNIVDRVEVTTDVTTTVSGFSFPTISIHEVLSQ